AMQRSGESGGEDDQIRHGVEETARRVLRSDRMTMLGALRSVLAARRAPRRGPRLVRRTVVHCPETGAPVAIDLLMADTGGPDMVLRCSGHPECPPTCHQACRTMAEAVVGPARALIICPPGSGPPEEIG